MRLFSKTRQIKRERKRAVCRRGLQIDYVGDSIYLDGGSTTLGLARLLKDRTDLTLVTNSLKPLANLLTLVRKFLIGGELRRISQTMVGPLTSGVLSQVRRQGFYGHDGFLP